MSTSLTAFQVLYTFSWHQRIRGRSVRAKAVPVGCLCDISHNNFSSVENSSARGITTSFCRILLLAVSVCLSVCLSLQESVKCGRILMEFLKEAKTNLGRGWAVSCVEISGKLSHLRKSLERSNPFRPTSLSFLLFPTLFLCNNPVNTPESPVDPHNLPYRQVNNNKY